MTTKLTHPIEPVQIKGLADHGKSPMLNPNHPVSEELAFLESQLHLSLEEIARLHNALAEANMRLVAYQKQDSSNPSTELVPVTSFAELIEDINSPLTTIANYTDLLSTQSVGNLGPVQLRFVERINRSLDQIHGILEQYRQEWSPEKPNTDCETTPISLVELIQETINLNDGELKQKQITLQLSIPEGLPEVIGSIDDISKVIDILVVNAFRVTPKMELVKISLSLENMNHASVIVLSVYDHGPGIPKYLLPGIFSMHGEQKIPGCSLSRKELFTLNQLIQDMGGQFSIERNENTGCGMKITLIPVKK